MRNLRLPLPAIICLLACLMMQPPLAIRAAPQPPPEDEDALIALVKTPFKGDLDQIRQRRMIRVLVNSSRTRFFYDHGRARGFEYELLKAFEEELNKGLKPHKQVKLVFIPVRQKGLKI